MSENLINEKITGDLIKFEKLIDEIDDISATNGPIKAALKELARRQNRIIYALHDMSRPMEIYYGPLKETTGTKLQSTEFDISKHADESAIDYMKRYEFGTLSICGAVRFGISPEPSHRLKIAARYSDSTRRIEIGREHNSGYYFLPELLFSYTPDRYKIDLLCDYVLEGGKYSPPTHDSNHGTVIDENCIWRVMFQPGVRWPT